MKITRTTKLLSFVWALALASGCREGAAPSSSGASGEEAEAGTVTQTAAPPGPSQAAMASEPQGRDSSPSSEVPTRGASAPEPGDDAASPLRCDGASSWKPLPLKHLQTGGVALPEDDALMPELAWAPCEGTAQCQRLKLREAQTLLTVGARGNAVRLVVSETCGDDTMVTVHASDGPAKLAFLGQDMSFDRAKAGGDRFLLGAMARHRSEQAADGFVPRDYLLTGREGTFFKIEPARNKLAAVPTAAASQIVQVKISGARCTTMFWKLGVQQCDFEGPEGDVFALFGAHMVFRDAATGKGMAWSVKEGEREILPQLEWVVTDGVNLAWSDGQHAFTAQPDWKLEKLSAEALSGPSGGQPLALGCGRTLTRQGDVWVLRNLQKGSYWELPESRVPADAEGPAVMDCQNVFFTSGHRLQLTHLGELKTFAAAQDAEASAPDLSQREVASAGADEAETPPASPVAGQKPAEDENQGQQGQKED